MLSEFRRDLLLLFLYHVRNGLREVGVLGDVGQYSTGDQKQLFII